MIVTAYIDESGTHGPSPTSVMAAYVAEARQWREYEKRARKLFRTYDVDVCHAIDIKRSHDDFRGWSKDKKIEFVDELGDIKNKVLEFGRVVVLKNSDYEAFYARRDRPRKVIKDTKYGVMFRALLARIVDDAIGVTRWIKHTPSPKLRLVLESGHRNAADAVRLYDFFCSALTDDQRKGLLAGISFESKDCLPLASADMLAYGAYCSETGAQPIGIAKRPLKSAESFRGKTRIHHIDQEALEAIYQQSLAHHEARQAFGQRVTPRGNVALLARSSET